jgi:Putative peptidoglycan binding domain
MARKIGLRASLVAALAPVLLGLLFVSSPANASTSSSPSPQVMTLTDSVGHAASLPHRPGQSAIHEVRPTAASCNYSINATQNFTFNGMQHIGAVFAGHYSGSTANPSTTQVTSAGTEAQCILVRYFDYNPGTIDGVFGPNSQAAMRQFQRDVNRISGAGLAVDGLPGAQSWRWLRWFQQ